MGFSVRERGILYLTTRRSLNDEGEARVVQCTSALLNIEIPRSRKEDHMLLLFLHEYILSLK